MKKFLKIFFFILILPLLLLICYFFIIKKLDASAPGAKDFYAITYDASQPLLLPSSFVDDQFYFRLPTATGDTLTAIGDSGGGYCMLFPRALNKSDLQQKIRTGLKNGVLSLKYIPFAEVTNDRRIPPPVALQDMIIRHPFSRVKEPFLIIPPLEPELQFMLKHTSFDIFLGQGFFMGKAWTFDYIRKEIRVNTPVPAGEAGQPGVQPLGLKKNAKGTPVYGHGSMSISVEGETIDMLFDTGATLVLTEEGQSTFHSKTRTLGGSYIAASLFDKWHKAHPQWKYYNKADIAGDVIEVPLIKIGGLEAGPVLFAKRPDEVWSKNMIGTMDKVVRGAIGGSALRYFKVTADYNSGLIRFEK